MQRGALESAVALLVHLAGLGFYVYVHVYDGTNAKRTGGKGLPGIGVFGGRWKFLTYINLVNMYISSRISLIQTPMGQKERSILVKVSLLQDLNCMQKCDRGKKI